MTGLARSLGASGYTSLPARTSGLARKPGATPFTTFATLGSPISRTPMSRSGGRTPRPNPGRARLRQRSAKTAARAPERRAVVAAVLAAFPVCQVRWDKDCAGASTDVHEPRMRSRGADICDPDQCVAACRYCHDAVHAHPAEATRRGWLIPSGRPAKAVPRG